MITWWMAISASALAASESTQEQARVERTLLTCRTRAQELLDEPQALLASWDHCAEEAKDRGVEAAIPLILGERTLVELRLAHPELKAQDPLAWSLLVLKTQAARPEATLPFEAVKESWLKQVSDPSTRQNLDRVRTVTVRPASEDSDPQAQAVYDLVRRHIGDLGFKVSLPDEASAADSAIHLNLGIQSDSSVRKTSRMTFHEVEIQLQCSAPRYVRLDAEGAPLKVSGHSTPTLKDQAWREAADQAAAKLAEALLRQVVQTLYAD